MNNNKNKKKLTLYRPKKKKKEKEKIFQLRKYIWEKAKSHKKPKPVLH
jgi:hypothetical protein